MTAEELQSQLTISGYESRVRGSEVRIHLCWFCGNDRWNLELNPDKGVYHCWSCSASGRLDSLLSDTLGTSEFIPVRIDGEKGAGAPLKPADDSFRRVPAEEMLSARTYLEKRGLGLTEIRAYQITVCTEKGHLLEDRILFPVQDYWTGVVLGYTGRSYTSRKPKYVSTLPRRVISGYRVRDRRTPCVMVEGFLDGIAVHRAGFQAAVLSGISSEAVQEFAARLPPETPLLILLDGSAREQALKLYWTISPIHPVTHLQLPPANDPAEFLPETLRRFLLAGLSETSTK